MTYGGDSKGLKTYKTDWDVTGQHLLLELQSGYMYDGSWWREKWLQDTMNYIPKEIAGVIGKEITDQGRQGILSLRCSCDEHSSATYFIIHGIPT